MSLNFVFSRYGHKSFYCLVYVLGEIVSGGFGMFPGFGFGPGLERKKVSKKQRRFFVFTMTKKEGVSGLVYSSLSFFFFFAGTFATC